MPAFELPRRIQASEERVEGSKVSGVGGGGDQDLVVRPDAEAAAGQEQQRRRARHSAAPPPRPHLPPAPNALPVTALTLLRLPERKMQRGWGSALDADREKAPLFLFGSSNLQASPAD